MGKRRRVTAMESLLAALGQRCRAFAVSGDASLVLEESAASQAQQLTQLIVSSGPPAGQVEVAAHAALGWLHWYRFQVLPEGANQADLEAALQFFSTIVEIAPNMVPGPVLQHLTQVGSPLPNSAARASAEALALIAEFQRSGNLDILNVAVDLLAQALDATPAGHPDRAEILSDLGFALRLRFERTGRLADLDAAIRVD